MPRYALPLLLILSLVLTAFAPSPAPWEKLGERTVNHTLDRDEIVVTLREGVFTQLKLKVRHRNVTFRDVKVHYANGDVQDVELRRRIRAGGETRVIDLEGNRRVIQKVVFWYDTTRNTGRRAVVELWGR